MDESVETVDSLPDFILRGLFSETLHPRGKGAQGGQFVSKGASGRNQSVGYDSKTKSGAGYGTAGGDARVKQLQRYLNSLGIKDASGKPLAVDGRLGPKTTSAIKRLQRKLGMKADGVVSTDMLSRLRRASARVKAGTYRPGNRKATHRAPAKKTAAPAHHSSAARKAPARKAASAAPQRPSASARKSAYAKNAGS